MDWWENFINWVEAWQQTQGFWTAVQGVATLVAAVAALVALSIAKSQLSQLIKSNNLLAASNEAMTQSNLALTRPYVVVDFELSSSVRRDGGVSSTSVFVLVQNAGRTPAKNLRLKVDHPFAPGSEPDQPGWAKAVAELNRAMDGSTVIKSLTNLRPLRYYLDEGGKIMGGDDDSEWPSWTVTATYEDADGYEFKESTTLELGHWRLAVATTEPLDRIGKMIEFVANEIRAK